MAALTFTLDCDPSDMHGHENIASHADAHDCNEMAEDTIALDRAPSARSVDSDGHWLVKGNLLSRSEVSPYRAEEIPGWENLGLEKGRVYKLYRHPDALRKAARSFEGKPLLMKHQPISADDHPRHATVGAILNPAYKNGELRGDLSIWDKSATDSISNNSQKHLSMGYRYTPRMEAGVTPDGDPYDGVMESIEANHGALVADPRVKDAVVADSREALDEALALDSEWETPGARRLLMALDAMLFAGGLDAREYTRGGDPKNPGRFSSTGGAGGGKKAKGKSVIAKAEKAEASAGKRIAKAGERDSKAAKKGKAGSVIERAKATEASAKPKSKADKSATPKYKEKKSTEKSKKDLTPAPAPSKSTSSTTRNPQRVTGQKMKNEQRLPGGETENRLNTLLEEAKQGKHTRRVADLEWAIHGVRAGAKIQNVAKQIGGDFERDMKAEFGSKASAPTEI